MFNIIKIEEKSLSLLQKMKNGGCNILYGAGSTGKECLKLLKTYNIRVDFFCDDDPKKWGDTIEQVPIISPKKLIIIKSSINLVITSIYAKRIYKKLPQLSNLVIFELFSIYGKNKGLIYDYMGLASHETKKIAAKLLELKGLFNDLCSKKVITVLANCIAEQNTDVYSLEDIVSNEECYFINEVLDAWKSNSNFVDAGSYTGEIIRTIDSLNLSYNRIYCFEVETSNYNILTKNANKKAVCINKGLWDKTGKLFIEPSDAATKIVDYKTDYSINVITIDEYFKNDKIDFIKMDIEGAEMKALCGGIKTIQKNRPILAISVYHSLKDLIEIPLYLFNSLKDYNFIIRHHSMIFAETVLYCIPKEDIKI